MIHRAHLRDEHQGRLHKGFFGENWHDFERKLKPFPNPHNQVHDYLGKIWGAPDNAAAMKASREAAKRDAKEFELMMKKMGGATARSSAAAPVYGGGYAMTPPATVRLRTVGVGGTATSV